MSVITNANEYLYELRGKLEDWSVKKININESEELGIPKDIREYEELEYNIQLFQHIDDYIELQDSFICSLDINDRYKTHNELLKKHEEIELFLKSDNALKNCVIDLRFLRNGIDIIGHQFNEESRINLKKINKEIETEYLADLAKSNNQVSTPESNPEKDKPLNNNGELIMSEQQEASKQEEAAKKICVFKTIKPLSTKDDQGNWHPVLDDNGKQAFDNVAFIFKAKESDTLYGTIKTSDGQSHNVLGFIKERNEDGKPNFISLCIKDENDKLKTVGNINAINSRRDDKTVYFDEAIITINNETINTKVGKKVDDDLHQKLGFTSPRLERPKFDPNAPKESSPSPASDATPKAEEGDKKKEKKRPKAK